MLLGEKNVRCTFLSKKNGRTGTRAEHVYRIRAACKHEGEVKVSPRKHQRNTTIMCVGSEVRDFMRSWHFHDCLEGVGDWNDFQLPSDYDHRIFPPKKRIGVPSTKHQRDTTIMCVGSKVRIGMRSVHSHVRLEGVGDWNDFQLPFDYDHRIFPHNWCFGVNIQDHQHCTTIMRVRSEVKSVLVNQQGGHNLAKS